MLASPTHSLSLAVRIPECAIAKRERGGERGRERGDREQRNVQRRRMTQMPQQKFLPGMNDRDRRVNVPLLSLLYARAPTPSLLMDPMLKRRDCRCKNTALYCIGTVAAARRRLFIVNYACSRPQVASISLCSRSLPAHRLHPFNTMHFWPPCRVHVLRADSSV